MTDDLVKRHSVVTKRGPYEMPIRNIILCPGCSTYVGAEDVEHVAQCSAKRIEALEAERDRLKGYLNTPQDGDFFEAVAAEQAHQRTRWNDDGKNEVDWGGVACYLAQKAVQAMQRGDITKARHHCVSTAALMANWYGRIDRQSLGDTND